MKLHTLNYHKWKLGNLTNDLQTNVTRESDLYDDILQEDFIDSYANLTVKSLMLLKWFSKSCEKVPYVLKTDDDVFINLKNLHALVTKNKKTNLLMGTLICGATPIRDPYNKWFSPKYMYGKKRYPNYLSGTGMEIQISVIKVSFLGTKFPWKWKNIPYNQTIFQIPS